MLYSISWYDWITPSNPFAAVALGSVIILVAALSYWYETKKVKEPFIVFIIGMIVVFAGAFLLDLIGFYD